MPVAYPDFAPTLVRAQPYSRLVNHQRQKRFATPPRNDKKWALKMKSGLNQAEWLGQ